MTDKVFNVADNGTPAASAAAGKLTGGNKTRRIGAPESPTSETAKNENPFKVIAARQAQAAVNQAAAPVVAAPQVEAAPSVPVPSTAASVPVVEKVEDTAQQATPQWLDEIVIVGDKPIHEGRNPADYFGGHVQSSPQTAPVAPLTPAVAPVSGQRDLVINTLLTAPARIFDSQRIFDETDRLYKSRLADLSIKALSEPMFPGKKDGDPNRAASNDTERDLAIQKLVATDMQLINFAASREAALRELMRDRNTFEAAKLAAQLLSNQAA